MRSAAESGRSSVRVVEQAARTAATRMSERDCRMPCRLSRGAVGHESGLFAGNPCRMDLKLKGLRAFVSGSTAGIGLAIAEELAREGASVVVNGRTPARVDEATRKLRAAAPSAEVRGVAADLGTAEGAAKAIEAAPDLDILVNNVGIF